MKNSKVELHFLIILLVLVSILAFFVFKPFLYALILAIVFATILNPIYQWITSAFNGHTGLSAVITLLLVIIFIFVPTILLSIQIFQETQQLYSFITIGDGRDMIIGTVNNVLSGLSSYFPNIQDISIGFDEFFKQGLNWLLQHLGSIFESLAKLTASAFLFLIALYYLLKDGTKLRQATIVLSPLSDKDDSQIFQKLKIAINSVIRGNILIALIQGSLTAIGFTIFGIPNAFLWGSVAAIAALIPGFGTALVIIPAILFLFFTGEMTSAIGLLIWGFAAVGLVDNLLGPKLVGRHTKLHPLIVLLSTIGGIGFFGPIGFILGPLTISMCLAIIEIYYSFRQRSDIA